jgi:hypothetical protein
MREENTTKCLIFKPPGIRHYQNGADRPNTACSDMACLSPQTDIFVDRWKDTLFKRFKACACLY